MDSLTQMALGAAVGGAVAGRQLGRKALVWGAICATLPDLDVFVPLGDPVSNFTSHRSASHSLLVHAVLTPPLAGLITRIHPRTRPLRWRWATLVFLALATHALLDAFTVYGTQLLWPLDTTPVAWSTIFIIDPAYTLPLLLGVALAFAWRPERDRGRRANLLGLLLASLYLAWTIGARQHVDWVAGRSLARAGIAATQFLSTPAPFNSILWRTVAVDQQHYYEGYYSMLDPAAAMNFTAHPRHPELIAPIADSGPVARLAWFTRGYYAAALRDGDVLLTDLRMGLEPDYIFSFKVGELGNPHARAIAPEQVPTRPDFQRLKWVWQRIADPQAGP